MSKETARILIVLTGSLGDVARGLAVPTAIKKHWPESHITWLVDSTWEGILAEHTAIDTVLIFDRKNSIRGNITLARHLRSTHFDICLDMQRHLKSGICSWLSGAKKRIGFHPLNTKEANHFFNTEYIDQQPDERQKLLQYFAFLDAINVERPKDISFGFNPSSFPPVPIEVSERKGSVRIGIVLSSSWVSKDWPLPGYFQLIQMLLRLEKIEIILLGGKSDSNRAAELEQNCKSNRLRNLAGKTSLGELLAVLNTCTIGVGPDSGPGHLCAAIGVPYVSLFGPTPATRVAPYGNAENVVRAAVPCSPCSRKRCPGLDTLCMRLITPEMVLQQVEKYL